jgi:uncharacterized protein (DUF1800 family)
LAPPVQRQLLKRKLLLRAGLLVNAALALSGCAVAPTRGAAEPGRADVMWLNRVTYGINSATLAEYTRRGRAAFLDEQFSNREAVLPAVVAGEINALEVAHADAAQLLAATNAEYKRINTLSDGPEKEQARKNLNDRGNALAYQAARRDVLRDIYSPAQLQEQLVWFWLNHFSVAQSKGSIRWLIGDYEERAIRPHVLGHFRELVMATLTHPAMLQYLDNAQNAVNHINENYARELMELHTLGVGAGYSQEDVQNLARILTGVGINAGGPQPKLKSEWQALYRRDGAFEFNPARHDFTSKMLLGIPIRAQGFAEVEQAVSILVREPACAQFVSRKLAIYFVADEPSAALLARMAGTFAHTDGDIAAVLKVLFSSAEFAASLGHKFKDPVHYVVSTLRLAYDTRPIVNTHPVINWLNGLGEAFYGHQTPDGYVLIEAGWASSGQMSRRFEIARAIASANAGLFEPEDGSAATTTGFPRFSTRAYFDALEPLLSARTQDALEHASSQQEWNTLLLASPEFNYR